jgi:hypothetical protein
MEGAAQKESGNRKRRRGKRNGKKISWVSWTGGVFLFSALKGAESDAESWENEVEFAA